MISLAKDTINKKDIKSLIKWLKGNPRLTMGSLTSQFEKLWCSWSGVKYSTFVNSGSSANLLALYALYLLKNCKRPLRNKNVIVPAVSWSTTVAPVIQLGFEPILCDCNRDNLGLHLGHLQELCKKYHPFAVIPVHVLGIPAQIEEIANICKMYDSLLLEDSCESIGSTINDKKTGTMGDVGTYSFYFGHHISTIEGGMIVTNNEKLDDIIKMIRSHGWDRNLSEDKKKKLRDEFKVSDFNSLYTFYHPGFNVRSTDLQAFIGLKQMERIDQICEKRNKNYELYDLLIQNPYWKPTTPENSFVSNHAYPIISRNRDKIVEVLRNNNVECRPLVCGSIASQPFWTKRFGVSEATFLDYAKMVNEFGLYVPNHHELKEKEIIKICDLVNKEV